MARVLSRSGVSECGEEVERRRFVWENWHGVLAALGKARQQPLLLVGVVQMLYEFMQLSHCHSMRDTARSCHSRNGIA
jgi:hypothetical protein